MRILGVLTAALASAALVAACSSGGTSPSTSTSSSPSLGAITIGAFNFTESQILAEIYAGALREVGYEPSVTQSTNREVLMPALQQGQVQVVPEYLGTVTEFLNAQVNGPGAQPVASSNVETTFTAAEKLAGPLGLTLLPPSPATDQNTFAVTQAFSTENSITSVSQMAQWSQTNELILGGPPECPQRPFCIPGLEKTYGMKIAEFVPLDAGGPLTKQALEQGKITMGLVFSSDGGLSTLGLVTLADDKGLQQAENITPAVLTTAVTAELTRALDQVSAALTTEELMAMNKAVDIDRKTPAEVAAEWLASGR